MYNIQTKTCNKIKTHAYTILYYLLLNLCQIWCDTAGTLNKRHIGLIPDLSEREREREIIIYGDECLRCGWRSLSRKRPRMWSDTEVVGLKGWEVIRYKEAFL